MVENSTNIQEVNYEGLISGISQDNNVEIKFEDKLKSCIQQLSRDPEDKTIENILNYSKALRKL